MALPTNGRVILDTTVGEIDIELWSKEAPKACRNFIALALEGYYDGVIFHRIVPGFLVQTGDRTGTGGGGESFFGEPFEDEIHPRLRYAHRGLVAMANNGTKNSNDSQFFITLDRTDELHGKHTLFGRCRGDTVYNVLKIGEMECDANERPLYPPKIKRVRIIDNPFDDIVPRITAAEKRAQLRAREEAQKEREEEMRRRGAKKNTKLLSFGDDEGEQEEEESNAFKKKPIVRPDLVEIPNQEGVLPAFVTAEPLVSKKEKPLEDQTPQAKASKSKEKDIDISRIREQHERERAEGSNARKAEIEKMEADIRKLTRKRAGSPDSEDEAKKKKAKGKSALQEELSKYAVGRGLHKKGKGGKRARDEDDVLAALNSFRGMLKSSSGLGTGDDDADEQGAKSSIAVPGVEDPGMEVDDDTDFLSHKLYFPKDNNEEVEKAERDYEVIDPRQRGARAKEEEKQRRKAQKPRDGGRGFSSRR